MEPEKLVFHLIWDSNYLFR